MIKLLIQETNYSFNVVSYELYDYNYEIYIAKDNYTVSSLKTLFKSFDGYACELTDTQMDPDSWGELPLTWASIYYALDLIEEEDDSFHLSFSSTAFKKREIERNTANIDYLAMMMDLELEEEQE